MHCLRILPLASLFFVACSAGSPDTSHVLGAYELDLTSFRARIEAEFANVPQDTAKPQVDALLAGVHGSVELRGDGTAPTTMVWPATKIDEKVPATWRLEGDTVVLTKKDAQNRDVVTRAAFSPGVLTTQETAGGKSVAIRWVRR